MIRTLSFLLISALSCSQPDVISATTNIDGTWVPESIAWERPDIDDPEIRNFRYASFATLSLRGSVFLMVESTNAPGDKDTIYLYTESGYNLYLGKMRVSDSLIIAEYRNVYRFIKFTGDTIRRLRTDTLTINNGTMLFKNKRYRRNSTIDTADINGLWRHAFSEEMKR
ncbi:hypothetical protein [Flavitalea sp.]|nr:hypothetical protein [Flavitalea sp.]